MKRFLKITSSVVLILAISGCTVTNPIAPQPVPQTFDQSLEVMDASLIRTIPDMTSVAFEWGRHENTSVVGYNLYRSNLQKDGDKLVKVATIKNRFVTHYVDTKLDPNTKYLYAITAIKEDGKESQPSKSVMVQTQPLLESVSYIVAISNMPKQIKILWRPHQSERVKEYLIERTDNSTSKWKEIEKISGRLNVEYIDTGLGSNEIYMYRIKSITFDNIVSKPSEIARANTKPLPEDIKNLYATKDLPRRIDIRWEPSNTNDVVSYKIYVANNVDGHYSELATVSASTLTYSHMVSNDGEVKFYKVSSIDKDSLESAMNLTPTMGSTLTKPTRPVITLAQIQGEKAIINWIAGDGRAKSYNIYKTTKTGFFSKKVEKIDNIQGLRFEDRDIVRGVEYQYSIQAVDEYGLHSEQTKETPLILPKLPEVK
jgi:fibronectin type 3 domain-containing protein